MLRLRNKLLPLVRLKEVLPPRRRRQRERLHRGDAGRQPDVRHRRRRRLPHRGNRGQADVVEAAPHPDVLRQHHSRRRLGDHDHRSERRRAGARPRRGRRGACGRRRTAEPRRGAATSDTVSLLVFRAGSQQPKAVPLSLVTRLEEIDCRKIEISDGRHLVQYRGQLMPLLRIDARSSLKSEGAQPLLVFSDQRPLHGAGRRRDRRHRRGAARHRSRRATARACSAPP